MIKVTINTLITIKPILQELANTKMPAKKSFQILRMLKTVDTEYASIEEVQQNMLINYGKRDETGNFILNETGTGYLIDDKNNEVFAKEMKEFLTSEIELDCMKITADFFDGIDLTPNQLLAIEPFIEINE